MKNHSSLTEAVHQLVAGLPRELREYVIEGQRPPNKNGYYETKLIANIGRLYLLGNDVGNCNNWIAGSFKGDHLTRWPIYNGDSELVYVGALPNSAQLHFGTQQSSTPFKETLRTLNGAFETKEHSEYLLLNALAHAIQYNTILNGIVYLLTERIPCSSCTHVISEFAKKFPNFKLRIIYMFDSPARGVKDFKMECTNSDGVEIYYLKFPDCESVNTFGPL